MTFGLDTLQEIMSNQTKPKLLGEPWCISLSGKINTLRVEPPLALVSPKMAFGDVPIRSSDILHNRWLPTCLFAQYACSVDDGLIWTMLLAEQFSPPRPLMMGAYQWSLLRFLVCSLDANRASYVFQVSVPDVDVGREGPFSLVVLNCTKTITACFSSRHSYCTFFPIPDICNAHERISASTVHFTDSVLAAQWHPSIESLLCVLTTSCINFFHASSASSTSQEELYSIAIDHVVDFTFLHILASSIHSVVSLLILKKDGSIEFLVVHLKERQDALQASRTLHTPTPESRGSQNFNDPEPLAFMGSAKNHGESSWSGRNSSGEPLTFQRVFLVEPEPSNEIYTNLFLLSSGSIFVVGRLAESGKVDIIGVDISFENLQRRLMLKKSLKDFSSFCLDSFTIPLQCCVAPRIHVNMVPPDSSKNPSAFPCPFVMISTPQDVILLEFPWLTQIEFIPTDLGCRPFLLPTHKECLVHLVKTGEQNSDLRLNLGMFLLHHYALDLAPRYVLLQATVGCPGYDPSLWTEEHEWIPCENFTMVSFSLLKKLTAKKMLIEFNQIMQEAWGLLAPQTEEREITKNDLIKDTTPQYKRIINSLQTSVESLAPANGMSGEVTIIRKVTKGETVQDFLAKLGAGSLTLWRIRHLNAQLQGLHRQIVDLKLQDYVRRVEQTSTSLIYKAKHLQSRLNALRHTNKEIRSQFLSNIRDYIVPLMDRHELSLIMDSILPLFRCISVPTALLFTDMIRHLLDFICSSVMDYVLLSRGVKDTQQDLFTLKMNLLRQRVRTMVVDLGINCHIFLALVSQAEWVFNSNTSDVDNIHCLRSFHSHPPLACTKTLQERREEDQAD